YLRAGGNTGIIEVPHAESSSAPGGNHGLPQHQCTLMNSFGCLTLRLSKDDEVQGTSISRAHTLQEIADFWDTHSLDDYWDQTHNVVFEIRAKQRLISSAC